MDEIDKMKTVIEYAEVPLSGPVYDGLDAKLTLEVRDFGLPERTLVINTVIDGRPLTTMVRWDVFTDALDGIRGRLMSGNWDDALSQLTGGSTQL